MIKQQLTTKFLFIISVCFIALLVTNPGIAYTQTNSYLAPRIQLSNIITPLSIVIKNSLEKTDFFNMQTIPKNSRKWSIPEFATISFPGHFALPIKESSSPSTLPGVTIFYFRNKNLFKTENPNICIAISDGHPFYSYNSRIVLELNIYSGEILNYALVLNDNIAKILNKMSPFEGQIIQKIDKERLTDIFWENNKSIKFGMHTPFGGSYFWFFLIKCKLCER